MQDKDLNKLNKLLGAMDSDNLTYEDLSKVLQMLLGVINDVRDELDSKVESSSSKLVGAVQETNYTSLQNQAKLSKTIDSKYEEVLKQIKQLTSKVMSEMENIKSSIPAVPDFNEFESNIMNGTKSMVASIEMDGAEKIRNKLSTLVGDERLDASAIKNLPEPRGVGTIGAGKQPVTVLNNGTVVSQNVKEINFVNPSSLVIVGKAGRRVDLVMPSGTGGYSVETPSGTINDSNVTFTVTATPVYIVVNGATYFENAGYTRSGTTLTLTLPVGTGGYIRSFYS